MTFHMTVDKVGRVVLPKPLRDHVRLNPGDTLEVEVSGDQISLRLVREPAPLRREHGVWVYRAGTPASVDIGDLLGRVREERIRDLME
jgi:AbrB family looped-hinge helix DNA binding protein